jgi:hypothetical protein
VTATDTPLHSFKNYMNAPMRELRELVLPLIVEAKHRQSLYAERETTPERPISRLRSRSYSSLGATMSDASTPSTPIFSPRSHSRFPSGASSLASSPNLRESLDGFSIKRPLTDVREEPTDGRDGDPERTTSFPPHASSPVAGPDRGSRSRAGSAAPPSFDGPNPAAQRCLDAAAQGNELIASYDWMDRIYDMDDFDFSAAKRRRGDESPRDGDGPFGARLRTLSRRFHTRKEPRTPSLQELRTESATRSRASSMRTTSIVDFRTDGSISCDAPRLPTPNASVVFEPVEEVAADDQADDDDATDAASTASRTPLLPPVLAPLQKLEEQIVSPLQSPKIAAAPSSPSLGSPQPSSPLTAYGLPSPPLSTKVSTASFHRRNTAGGSGESTVTRSDAGSTTVQRPIVSTSDIPPILLSQPPDEWSQQLGHANFTIHPEPYKLGAHPTQAMLQGLASDWALARRHFAQHLASTGEHYGASSKVHALTRLKWESVESHWRAAYQEALVLLPPAPVELHPAMQPVSQQRQVRSIVVSPTNANNIAKEVPLNSIAPLGDRAPGSTLSMPPVSETSTSLPNQACASRALIQARCDVKFPQISLEDVVGPMTRITRPEPAQPPRHSRKRAFWRFLQGILPGENGLRRREAVY